MHCTCRCNSLRVNFQRSFQGKLTCSSKGTYKKKIGQKVLDNKYCLLMSYYFISAFPTLFKNRALLVRDFKCFDAIILVKAHQ